MISWFKKKTPTVTFKSIAGHPYISPLTQVKLAKDVKPNWLVGQRKNNANDKFMSCPGMVDLMQDGYIIPAWTDIHIKANRAGTFVKEFQHIGDPVEPMNDRITSSFVDVDDSVKFKVTKIPVPWAIQTKKGYSVYAMAATYHSPFLKDLYVYQGVVDYDSGFVHCNFIFTALKECEIIIPAGTPLLQIIPYKREEMSAICARGDISDIAKKEAGFPTRVKAAYRKFFHKRKKYTLDIQV